MKVKVFYEEIYYCPSQLYYYFELPGGEKRCLYLRQRGMPYVTAEIARCDEKWILSYAEGDWELLPLEKDYDINNQPSPEKEEEQILAVERRALELLRDRFPGLDFPDSPERITERLIFD